VQGADRSVLLCGSSCMCVVWMSRTSRPHGSITDHTMPGGGEQCPVRRLLVYA